MAGDQFYTIHPRKGEIALLDMKTGKYFDTVVGKPELSMKPRNSKGGGMVKTIEGNILIGPNNYEVEYREDYGTNRETLDNMLNKELKLIPELKKSDIITYFAGTRAATYKEDFIIEQSEHVKNFIHVAGIQSPGFASAPAISDRVKNICVDYLKTIISVREKLKFNPNRKAPADLMHMSMLDRARIIKKNPDYGTIVCRCEEISKGEVIDALRSPLPVDTVDGVKRRTRAGMGRCQGGFCLPHVMHIIEEEKGIKPTEVYKKNTDGVIVVEETKGDRKYV
jgi:glycerol-3-phosphate dehydrogenase